MNINKFLGALPGGGVRPNLFKVTGAFPTFVTGAGNLVEKFSLLCKGASLPASTLGSINIPYRGRTLKIPGDRTFEQWSVTIINDDKFALRRAFEKWHNAINQRKLNTPEVEYNIADFMTDFKVEQLDRAGAAIESITLFSAWPVSVSAITLSNDGGESIEEFSVAFDYIYWDYTNATATP